jgi:hypothetical protein
MKPTKGIITIGHWHFKLGITRAYWIDNGFLIQFGIFKFLSMPQEGMEVTKANYKGFWLRKKWFPKGFEISF